MSGRYIGDLGEEIRALERQAQASDTAKPKAISSQDAQGSDQPRKRPKQSKLRDLGRQDDSDSPNFVEGGGIRSVQRDGTYIDDYLLTSTLQLYATPVSRFWMA